MQSCAVDPHLRAASQDTREVDNCETKRDEYSRGILGIFSYGVRVAISNSLSLPPVVNIKLRQFGRSKSCTHQLTPLFASEFCRLSPYARHQGVASSTQSCS